MHIGFPFEDISGNLYVQYMIRVYIYCVTVHYAYFLFCTLLQWHCCLNKVYVVLFLIYIYMYIVNANTIPTRNRILLYNVQLYI